MLSATRFEAAQTRVCCCWRWAYERNGKTVGLSQLKRQWPRSRPAHHTELAWHPTGFPILMGRNSSGVAGRTGSIPTHGQQCWSRTLHSQSQAPTAYGPPAQAMWRFVAQGFGSKHEITTTALKRNEMQVDAKRMKRIHWKLYERGVGLIACAACCALLHTSCAACPY